MTLISFSEKMFSLPLRKYQFNMKNERFLYGNNEMYLNKCEQQRVHKHFVSLMKESIKGTYSSYLPITRIIDSKLNTPN